MGCLKLAYRTNDTALKVVQGGLYASGKSCAGAYRFGFGGHEKDDEIKGSGNHISFNDYGYDPRTGRRFGNDPVFNPSISPYAVFNNNPNFYVDPDGQSPISIFAKAALKSGIKIAAKEFIEAQVKKRLAAYMSKGWAKQLAKDADAALETMDTEWWEYAIEFIPIAGDAYGGYKLGKNAKKLWNKLNYLEAKAERMISLSKRWGDKGAELIESQLSRRGALRGALEKAGKKLDGVWQAHHIIPIEALNKSEVVQAAVQAGFDVNSATNGMALSTDKHSGSHKKYNAFILESLGEWAKKQKGDIDPKKAREFIETELIPDAKKYIESTKAKLD